MSVFDNIAAGKYENKTPHSVEKIPIDEETMTIRQAKEHVEEEKRRQNDQHNTHLKERYRLQAVFRRDLEEDYGVSGHPKADKLWEIAYEAGHSGGFNDIACNYDRMVGLIKD